MVKNLPGMQETWVWSLAWEEPLEKGTATHSSILAWRIPWTEQPDNTLSFPSLIANYLNLPFGIQGWSRGPNEAYFLQMRNGAHRKDLYHGGHHRSYSISLLIIVKHLILDCFLYPLKQIRNPNDIRITLPLLPLTSANRFHHINVFPLFPLLTGFSVASYSGWLIWEVCELSLASGMAISRSSQSISSLGFSLRLLTTSYLFVLLQPHHLPISNNLPANIWDVFLKWKCGDFCGGTLVRILNFHCRGHVFDPWSEN